MSPKILLIDCETSPLEALVFGIWNVNIGLNQIVKDTSLMSIAWKWAGEKTIHCESVSASSPRNDLKLAKLAQKLISESDLVIAHNLDRFDMPVMKGRMLVHDLDPPPQPRGIDTLKIARRHFKLTSNKLEHLANVLNLPIKKMVTRKFDGMTLWTESLKGNKAALAEMREYNKRDVEVLEAVYHKLVRWEPRISFDVYSQELANVCTCGNDKWQENGHAYTAKGKFKRYKCTKCGKERRKTGQKNNLLSKTKRSSL